MENYVSTLVKRIRKSILRDLKMLMDDAEPTDEVVKAVLMEGVSNNSDKEQY